MSTSDDLTQAAEAFLHRSLENRYSYSFSWLGRPIIQYPQDIVAIQDLIWRLKPDLIIETGVAHGGSTILLASLLKLNELCGGPLNAKVVSVEIALRDENRIAIKDHPLSAAIELIDGSSTDPRVASLVHARAADRQVIMVLLDSNHTHDHVFAELQLYAGLVTVGSYCIVLDTVIDKVPHLYPDREWGDGNNPASAIRAFLADRPDFEVDSSIDQQLLISVAPGGYLRRIQ